MVRRLIAASFTAVTLTVLSATPAMAQAVSPPTSEVSPSSAVQGDSTSALPRTGSDAGPSVLVGVGLTAAGAGLVLAARRRRTVVGRNRPRHLATS